eukprot:567805-Prorocentrum_minimum.AAC.1
MPVLPASDWSFVRICPCFLRTPPAPPLSASFRFSFPPSLGRAMNGARANRVGSCGREGQSGRLVRAGGPMGSARAGARANRVGSCGREGQSGRL